MVAWTYELWYTDEDDNETLIGQFATEKEAENAIDKNIPLYAFYEIIKKYI